MDKVNILGVHVDMVNISQATDCIMRFLDEDKFHAVYTPNSEIIMLAYKDEKFCKLLNNADLLTADGIGVVHASKILKKPISERAAGYDIARQVLQKMNYTDHKLFLFGGKPGVAEEAKKKQVSLFQITLNLKRNLNCIAVLNVLHRVYLRKLRIIIRLCVRTLICIRALFIKCLAYLPKCIHRFSLFQELSAGAHIDLKKLSAAAELSDRRISRWYTVRNTRK